MTCCLSHPYPLLWVANSLDSPSPPRRRLFTYFYIPSSQDEFERTARIGDDDDDDGDDDDGGGDGDDDGDEI